MSRSAADATRFTATGPYASSKSSSPGSNLKWPSTNSQSSPSASAGAPRTTSKGPPGETPKQKVERLRAEARAARLAKSSSPVDRFLSRGRVWADRAHRITIYSLIAASGVAGILTIYSITSLVIYNRRQKTLWLDREMQRLLDAKKAYVAGNPTVEQLELLEKEKAAEEAHLKKEELRKQTYFYKGKQLLFGDLSMGEGKDGEKPIEGGILEAVNAKRREDEAAAATATERQILAPSTESLGTAGEKVDPEGKKSWSSWILRR
ncbi:hypothetical protein FQN54_008929 [Arachnomyces sp. PD_36]|nr:hypothetical protein FQN54_008929 [Arachnomyces sp. PD_36]